MLRKKLYPMQRLNLTGMPAKISIEKALNQSGII
jgi:hypothetical protein